MNRCVQVVTGHPHRGNMGQGLCWGHHSIWIITTRNMLVKILLLALVSRCMGFKQTRNNYGNKEHEHDHHDTHKQDQHDNHDHDEDDCVDVSKYSQLEYKTTRDNICTYRVERTCWPRSERVCIILPSTQCTMEAGYTCDTQVREEMVRCDETQTNTFTPRKCVPDGSQTVLRETKQVPQCRNVTQQVCDSRWEINQYGQKVFASNENCRDKTWEQCELVDKVVEDVVPALICLDEPAETYMTLMAKEELTTLTQSTCSATGGAVCVVSSVSDCTEVTWTECEEKVVTECQPVTVKIPFQEKEHRRRCIIGH